MKTAEHKTIQAMRNRQLTQGIHFEAIISTFELMGFLARIVQVGQMEALVHTL